MVPAPVAGLRRPLSHRSTSFVVGAGGDDLFARAYDGTNWSVEVGTWDHFHMTGL
jgi:hypothetical protein